MSYKTSFIKMAIKWTPKSMVTWVANIVLKGIAELTDYSLDLDARTAYVQTTLAGEAEPIEVWLEGFAIIGETDAYHLVIQNARSNRLWLDNIFARIIGKAWKIPAIPQLAVPMGLAAELLKAKDPVLKALPIE